MGTRYAAAKGSSNSRVARRWRFSSGNNRCRRQRLRHSEGMNHYDVAIVGGSAAGLSAALVLSRARRCVAVVDAGQPRNAPAAHMQGFLGYDGMPPHELLAARRRRSPATAAT
jgi:hypothetical protein